MSEFTEHLYRGITGRAPDTEARSVADMVNELRATLGAHPPAGVSRSTWGRLRRDPGRRVTPRIQDALRLAQRRARLSAGRERRLRAPRPGIRYRGWVKISQDARFRTFKIGELTDPSPPAPPIIAGMLGPVLDAWLLGNDDAAEQRFMGPIEARMGGSVYFWDIEYLRLGRLEDAGRVSGHPFSD